MVFRKKTRSAEIEAQLSKLQARQQTLSAEAAAAGVALDRAGTDLQRFLETGDLADDAKRTRLEAAALAADGRAAPLARALDALHGQIASLSAELAEARAEERREAGYATAVELVATATHRLSTDYQPAAAKILELIAVTADALAAVEAANVDLPAGKPAILAPLIVGGVVPTQPEEIVSAERVDMWCFAASGKPIADQAAVTPLSSGRGSLKTSGRDIEAVLRPFRLERYRAARGIDRNPIFHEVVALPGLAPGAPELWTPVRADPDAVAEYARAQIDAARRAPPGATAQPILERLTAIE